MKSIKIAFVLIFTSSLLIGCAGTGKVPITGEEEKVSHDISEMVLIPAGNFTMGSDEYDNEKPAHRVYIDAYYIDKYEVTNQKYKVFIDAGGYNEKTYWTEEGWQWKTKENITKPYWWDSGEYNSGPSYANYPVVGISWYEAYAFAKWAGKRLPTEAEWEKAARGIDARTYPWGEGLDNGRANYNSSGSTPVGSYPSGASPYGCLDMTGNVWEWCNDWYQNDYYSISPSKNPQGSSSGTFKVLRGGSWDLDVNGLRCAVRYYFNPDFRNFVNGVGFRCVQ